MEAARLTDFFPSVVAAGLEVFLFVVKVPLVLRTWYKIVKKKMKKARVLISQGFHVFPTGRQRKGIGNQMVQEREMGNLAARLPLFFLFARRECN